MTPEHIELVKSTVPVLRENGVALTKYFYNRMLTNNPDLKNIFNMDHQSSGRQPRALAGAVLAYAEHIEDPSSLARVLDHIGNKHVSLDIQADQYSIVGENLLHSISEVLNVPFESDLIAAWKEAYLQLAAILIDIEKKKYDNLAALDGGWAGWRAFEISAIEEVEEGKKFTLKPQDGNAIPTSEPKYYISVKVQVPNHEIQQPQQFAFTEAQQGSDYQIVVKPEKEPTEFSVANILLDHYKVGDTVQVTAPLIG